jgi:hypothetical protein
MNERNERNERKVVRNERERKRKAVMAYGFVVSLQ